MGISFLTASIIKSHKANDIRCLAAGSGTKWAGLVYLYEGEEIDRLLLSTEAGYLSEKEAIRTMKKIIRQVRAAKL